MGFATVEDLERRWKKLSEAERERAEVLLDDASDFIRAEFAYTGKELDDTDELMRSNLRIVTCSVVKRMMAASVDQAISQMSQTAGSYSAQMTFANPNGDMYMTDREYRLLGIARKPGRAMFSNPFMEASC